MKQKTSLKEQIFGEIGLSSKLDKILSTYEIKEDKKDSGDDYWKIISHEQKKKTTFIDEKKTIFIDVDIEKQYISYIITAEDRYSQKYIESSISGSKKETGKSGFFRDLSDIESFIKEMVEHVDEERKKYGKDITIHFEYIGEHEDHYRKDPRKAPIREKMTKQKEETLKSIKELYEDFSRKQKYSPESLVERIKEKGFQHKTKEDTVRQYVLYTIIEKVRDYKGFGVVL